MVTKVCVGDYVGYIYHRAKFYPNSNEGFRFCACVISRPSAQSRPIWAIFLTASGVPASLDGRHRLDAGSYTLRMPTLVRGRYSQRYSQGAVAMPPLTQSCPWVGLSPL